MSYKRVRWTCRRDRAADGRFTYTILPGSGMAQLVADVKDNIHRKFLGEAATLRAALELAPEDLKKSAADDSDMSTLVPDPQAPQISDRSRALLTAFFSLPQTQQDQTLNGGPMVTVPAASLPSTVQAYVERQAASTGLASNAPPTLTFQYSNFMPLTPELVIGLNAGGLGMVGNSIGGGMREQEWENNIAGMWLLPDDTGGTQQGPQVLMRPTPWAPFTSSAVSDKDRSLESMLWKISEAAPVTILAVLPHQPPVDTPPTAGVGTAPGNPVVVMNTAQTPAAFLDGTPYGLTLADALGRIRDEVRGFTYKTRGEILLMRNASAPFYAVAPPPNR